MDDFKPPKIDFSRPDNFQWDEDVTQKKLIKSAQFDCLPAHVGLAVAMRNFWIFYYDLITDKKIH